ncbi:MAG: DUF1631 family protein [Hydrogenophaga sp.]|uniref:DUF1631 family protein n=1 Tax=Hydrogenophaga sp. TaxID=1904254 RepID=UPI0025C32EEF|nr:DUF1631 family protein [Hydrogenophaga sp.]MBT9550478.1 DUF1631 family protein [Hydrogenophaga sp.]
MDASPNESFDACLKEALVQTRAWIPRWLTKLREALQQRESAASRPQEKQALGQARTTLESHHELIAARFLEAFAESVEGALPSTTNPTRSLKSLSFDELELMGDEQVQETVELARVQQVIKISADEALNALNARMSSARGLQRVRIEANPLRSEVVVTSLMRALNGLHVEPAVRSRWLQTGAVAFGEELRDMYVRLSALLDSRGIEPAGYTVIQTPRGRTPAPEGSVRSESVSTEAVRGPDALLTLDHLHQLLVGNLDQSGSGPSDQGASGSGNAMVRTLAAEVVTLMLRRLTTDERLLAPLRDMLQGMKPALLLLARSDPRFFADRHNPARRLLDAIAERGLAFTSEQDAGYQPFATQVHDIVRALQSSGADLPDRFPGLLELLTRSRAEALVPRQAQARGLAVQTLMRVEQRNLLAERVATEFRARNDFERAPGVVRRFLTGPWSQVVAQARMDAAEKSVASVSLASAAGYTDIVPDLLWSSQLAQASRNRPRLIKIIPGLLRTLREGLDAIDYPRTQSESFFSALMGLHEAAYKTQREAPVEDSPPSHQFEPEADEPWMHPVEARDTGFMEDALMDTQPAFVDTEIMPRDWSDAKEAVAREGGQVLPVGAWVDVWYEGRALRCQVTWASPHGTMFLFTGSDGRSLSMTRRGVERLLAQDRLRVVANHGMVDDALDAVARQACINSALQP